jgi:Right handed beta helix region
MQIACRRAKVLFVSLLFVFSFVVIAPAQSTIHVPADVPSIQQAIFQANNGDVVLVSPGTYFEVLNFQGKAITVQSTDGPAVTIIDAQNSFSAVSFTNGEGPGAVLRGFTVTHGFGSQEGGGIEIVNGSPTIDGNVITANQACSGSGISANGSSSVISNNTISNNSTSACTPPQGGAGIRIVGAGNVHLLNNTITGNQITNGGNGGGVVVDVLAAPLVSGNLIQNNSTVGNGGGIAVNSSALLVNNVIANNSAATGGGIYSLLNQAQPSFLNNTVAGNSANQGTQLFIDGLWRRCGAAPLFAVARRTLAEQWRKVASNCKERLYAQAFCNRVTQRRCGHRLRRKYQSQFWRNGRAGSHSLHTGQSKSNGEGHTPPDQCV